MHSSCAPDVAILELHMPVLNGIEVTREARKLVPSPAMVLCSEENDAFVIKATKKAGAFGFGLNIQSKRDLITAVTSFTSRKRVPTAT